MPAPTAGDIARICRDFRCGCDEDAFISRAADDCIARDTGLATGVAPGQTRLGCFENHQRVCWSVMTVRESTSDGLWGESLVDATTGEQLDRGTYSVCAGPQAMSSWR